MAECGDLCIVVDMALADEVFVVDSERYVRVMRGNGLWDTREKVAIVVITWRRTTNSMTEVDGIDFG